VFSASLRLPTLGYTVDSFAPAQLALRANLRLLFLSPAPALDCLFLRSSATSREHLFSQRRSSGFRIGREEVFVFPVAFFFEVFSRNEAERRGVNTIADSSWGGAIGEDVAKVGVAFHRTRFDTFHSMRRVFFLDARGSDRFEKARPSFFGWAFRQIPV